MADVAQEHVVAANLRAGIVGRVGHQCPVAGCGEWVHGLNADFEDGSRPWRGDILVPSDRWLLHAKIWPEPQARRRQMRGGLWEDYEPHLDAARGLLGLAGFEPGRSLIDWLPVAENGDTPHGEPQGVPGPASAIDWGHRAIEQIPRGIRTRLANFRFGQWRLLRLVARKPATLDLLDSNPALAWALASASAFLEHRPSPIDDAAAADRVGQRQREIAAWLGFPGSEGSVRLLKKVPPDSCGTAPLLELRKLAAVAETAERLRHLRELPATVILAVGSRILGPSLTPAALRDVVEEIARLRNGRSAALHPPNAPQAPAPTIVHLLEDAARVAQMLPGAQPPRPVHSLRALRRRHDELVDQFNQFAEPRGAVVPPPEAMPAEADAPLEPTTTSRGSTRDFPPPPLPPGDGIVPITSRAALTHEGRAQINCVASYVESIRSGEYYVYRVTKPSRATLGLRCDRQGHWHMDQLAGFRNRTVSMELRAHVLQWFHASVRLDPAKLPPAQRPARRRHRAMDDPTNPVLPGL